MGRDCPKIGEFEFFSIILDRHRRRPVVGRRRYLDTRRDRLRLLRVAQLPRSHHRVPGALSLLGPQEKGLGLHITLVQRVFDGLDLGRLLPQVRPMNH